MSRSLAWLAGLAVGGCELSEQEFEAKLADKACTLYFHCEGEGDTPEMPFDDEAGCRDYYVDFFHDAGCDFDADQGRACLNAIDVDDCSGDGLYAPECDDVYVPPCSKDD